MSSFCKIADLRSKQVINVSDGRCLGCVSDVEINVTDGSVIALKVPDGASLFSPQEITIPWERIEKIGDDTILVNIGEICGEKKKKKTFFS